MKLNVHIERLVIESGEPITREQLTEAIRRELRARLGAEGLPTHLRASGMHAAAGQSIESPRGLGDAIYGSLRP
jgi:hypothetical protein